MYIYPATWKTFSIKAGIKITSGGGTRLKHKLIHIPRRYYAKLLLKLSSTCRNFYVSNLWQQHSPNSGCLQVWSSWKDRTVRITTYNTFDTQFGIYKSTHCYFLANPKDASSTSLGCKKVLWWPAHEQIIESIFLT